MSRFEVLVTQGKFSKQAPSEGLEACSDLLLIPYQTGFNCSTLVSLQRARERSRFPNNKPHTVLRKYDGNHYIWGYVLLWVRGDFCGEDIILGALILGSPDLQKPM